MLHSDYFENFANAFQSNASSEILLPRSKKKCHKFPHKHNIDSVSFDQQHFFYCFVVTFFGAKVFKTSTDLVFCFFVEICLNTLLWKKEDLE